VAKLDDSDYARDYGFQLAFLKSDPDLYKLFKEAVDNGWDAQKFQAELMQSKWYRTHGENYRQTVALQKTDPATYKSRLASLVGQIADKAAAMGVTFSDKQLNNLATHSLMFGWNENQLNNVMAKYITFSGAKGQAANNISAMQQAAWRNGLKFSGDTYRTWAQKIARGDNTVDDFQKYVRKQAAGLAPSYADELNSGVDLWDVAQPYMQSMAQLLELNPADISLFDPTIRGALSAKGPDGKPTSKSLWQFENEVRQDPRWLKTKNAQDAVYSVSHQVLQTFGLMS
jgi:hypothetical protein